MYTSKNEVRGSISQYDFNYNNKKKLFGSSDIPSIKKDKLKSGILNVLTVEAKDNCSMLKSM